MRAPILVLVSLMGCSAPDPSDDPDDWEVDTSVEYVARASEARFVVPADNLPSEVTTRASNNNVDIHFYGGRLFMAWRSSPIHFAGPDTTLWVISSTDMGESWDFETRIALESDAREPRFLTFDGELQLMFFEAGIDPWAFEPISFRRVWRNKKGDWTESELIRDAGEVPWDVKVRGGVGYLTSYEGTHYGGTDALLEVYFKQSVDGRNWTKVDGVEAVYTGGISEVAFEFDEDGGLWTVGRNEDGDDTGTGSHVCYAPPDDLAAWQCPDVSDPERYDSPEMFRHGDDIYLVARRDIGGPFGDDPNLLPYSGRPKTTALYAIDREARAVVHLMDLPGVGDTAFPSVRRTGAHTFLMANYTSPLDEPDISWVEGQTSDRGTQLYLLDLTFEPL
jgi:hypothetical protein